MGADAITLRLASRRDFGAVDAVLAASYPRLLKNDYPPSVMVTAVPLLARANPSLLTSGTYYIAESSGGRILGAGGWTPGRRGTGWAEVRHLIVHWQHQREGIGRRLMTGILAEARRAGVRRMDAQATRTAVPFYEAMGFERLGAIDVSLRPGITFPAEVMRLSL